jgi:hypothetical protein
MIVQNEDDEIQNNETPAEEENIIQNNKENSFQNQNQITNQNIYSEENQITQTQGQIPTQSNDKAYQDEEGNLLDPNDLSFNSEEDKTSIIIFDMEINFIKNIAQIDIVFLLDTTKSVNPYLKGIKRYIRKLIFDAKKSLSHYLNDDFDILNYGLVAYRDHDQEGVQGSYVSKILCDLNEDYNVFRKALYDVKCAGGDDTCEAVVDGLQEAVNLISWREDGIKLLYHICGSPCHGTAYNGVKKNKKFDKYPDGCPCGVDMKTCLKSLRGKYIEYNLIGLDEDLKDMANKFSDYIKVELVEVNIPPQEGVPNDQTKNDNENE